MDRQEAIEVVKSHWPEGWHMLSEALEVLIPDLRESEDDRIRKRIIDLIHKVYANTVCITHEEFEEITAWLEKQGKQTT